MVLTNSDASAFLCAMWKSVRSSILRPFKALTPSAIKVSEASRGLQPASCASIPHSVKYCIPTKRVCMHAHIQCISSASTEPHTVFTARRCKYHPLMLALPPGALLICCTASLGPWTSLYCSWRAQCPPHCSQHRSEMQSPAQVSEAWFWAKSGRSKR